MEEEERDVLIGIKEELETITEQLQDIERRIYENQ